MGAPRAPARGWGGPRAPADTSAPPATTPTCASTSGRSTSCVRRAAAARSSSPTPSAPRLTSRPTGQPATAGAVPRPARTARLTCSSAMHPGTRAGTRVSERGSLGLQPGTPRGRETSHGGPGLSPRVCVGQGTHLSEHAATTGSSWYLLSAVRGTGASGWEHCGVPAVWGSCPGAVAGPSPCPLLALSW